MKTILPPIARVLFAVPFIIFGVLHFMNGAAMSGLVPAFLPAKVLWVYLTGLAMFAAGVIIIVNKKYVALAALVLGILVSSYVVFIHLPGVLNPDTMQSSLSQMLKDLMIAGGAFFIAAHSKK